MEIVAIIIVTMYLTSMVVMISMWERFPINRRQTMLMIALILFIASVWAAIKILHA